MQKAIGKIFDQTSGAGATLTASFTTLESVDALIVYFITSGAAASTAMTLTAGDAKDTSATTPAATFGSYAAPAAGASATFGVGPGSLFDCPYLPSKLSFSVTAGAASTVRIVVYAVRMS